MKPQCDFQLGVTPGVLPCTTPPAFRCICARCQREGDDGTFRSCAAHRTNVEERHGLVCPAYAVVWQGLPRALDLRGGEWRPLDDATLESLTVDCTMGQGGFGMRLLAAEVWRLRKVLRERDVCVVCATVLIPGPGPYCEGCESRYQDGERYSEESENGV